MSSLFIKVLKIIFLNIPEQCQNLVKTAQNFAAQNIPHIILSDYAPVLKPFRLV